MSVTLSQLTTAYIEATNTHDPAAFSELFLPTSVVDDNHREFRGREAIEAWAKSDIFGANVSLEVLKSFQCDGELVLRTKVDGNFDRTGLPDPVVIDHALQTSSGKIAKLTCRLAEE